MDGQVRFKEALPEMSGNDLCPPRDAEAPIKQIVVRFIPAAPPKAEHFLSHHALGRPLPYKVDLCRWASCSVYKDLPALNKLPKLRERFQSFARLEIDEAAGVVKLGKGGHLDLWMFSTFDPLNSVLDCSPL